MFTFPRHARSILTSIPVFCLLTPVSLAQPRGFPLQPRTAPPAEALVAVADPRAEEYPPIRTRFHKDTGPTRFPSAYPWNYDDPMLWKGVSLAKDDPVTWPFGYGSVVVWEGGTKVFLDLRNDGRQRTRLKAIGGVDNLADMRVSYPRRTGPYRIVVRGLGEEDFLGLPVRFGKSRVFPLRFARACHREGTFRGKRFSLIDDSLNGNYDDFGKDTVLVHGESIQPLSRVLRFGSRLYRVVLITPDGTTVKLADYTGETGRIAARWRGPGRVDPAMLVFRCVRGEFVNAYFNLADGEAAEVPVGYYAFAYGVIRTGEGRTTRFVRIGPGRNRPFAVGPDAKVTRSLGAPFEVEAGVAPGERETLRVPGSSIRIHGASGEEYFQFYPSSFEADVSVRAVNGRLIVAGERPGRPAKADADQHGISVMWYPRDVEFDGSTGTAYEVKVDVESELLGPIEGRWHAAALP